MRREAFIRVGCVAVLALALGACSGVRDQLGLTKKSPDEFKVVSRAPLTLPPNFDLRPPRPGAERTQESAPSQQARQAVFRAPKASVPARDVALTGTGRTPGEEALLRNAGADKVAPNVRALVDRETNELNQADEDFLQMLVFWRKREPTGVVVDAEAEARRLRENTALGKSATAGETPTIERRKKALLEGIF